MMTVEDVARVLAWAEHGGPCIWRTTARKECSRE